MKKLALTGIIQILCLFLIVPPSLLLAGPQGGKVVAGQAKINASGAETHINQSSKRAVINWDTFDIGKNELVNHRMPDRNSAALHRVIGGRGASQLEGTLKSNGNIFLVNPKGVVIHNGARVETGGFVASTADIKNKDFMAGNLNFNIPGDPNAAVVNQGQISVRDQGYAALVAPRVRNDGVIAGRLGKVALASADQFKLDVYGDDLVNFAVSESQADQFYTPDGVQLGVENSGQIKAEGGVVLLTAKQLDKVVASSVNNSGLVEAGSAEMKGGKIVFGGAGKVNIENTGDVRASSGTKDGGSVTMASEGAVKVAGTVEAKGKTKGGRVDISGEKKTEIAGANISTEGETEGLIRLGGEFQGGKDKGASDEAKNGFVDRFGKTAPLASTAELSLDAASAITAGHDGTLVAWSDGLTEIHGDLAGRFVETSGKRFVMDSTPAVSRGGHWLIDPANVEIVTGDAAFDSSAEGNTTVGANWLTSQVGSDSGFSLHADGLVKVSASLSLGDGFLGLYGNVVSIDASISSNGGSLSFDGQSSVNVNGNISGFAGVFMGGSAINVKNGVSIIADSDTGSAFNGGRSIVLGAYGSSPDTNITIGENVKITAPGEIVFNGKNAEIKKGTQITSTSDDVGRILFWGGLESGTNDVKNPFESVKFGSGVQLNGQRGIEIYSKYTELVGAALITHSDESQVVISASRTWLPDSEEGYEYHPDNAIINLLDDSDGNISSITSAGGIDLAMERLEFGSAPGTRIASGSSLRLIAADGSTIHLPRGSLTAPVVSAQEISFEGNNATYRLEPYAVKAGIIWMGEGQIKMVGEGEKKEPHIFGLISSKPEYSDEASWAEVQANLKAFQKKYPTVILAKGNGSEQPWTPEQIAKLQKALQEAFRKIGKDIDVLDHELSVEQLLLLYKTVTKKEYYGHWSPEDIAQRALDMKGVSSELLAYEEYIKAGGGIDSMKKTLFDDDEDEDDDVAKKKTLTSTDGKTELNFRRVGNGQCVTLVTEMVPELNFTWKHAVNFMETYPVGSYDDFRVSYVPTVGSVFMQEVINNTTGNNKVGHTGIVTNVDCTAGTGTCTLTLLEQNFNNSVFVEGKYFGKLDSHYIHEGFTEDQLAETYVSDDRYEVGGLGIITQTRQVTINVADGKDTSPRGPAKDQHQQFVFVSTATTDQWGAPGLDDQNASYAMDFLINREIVKPNESEDSYYDVPQQKQQLKSFLSSIEQEDWKSTMEAVNVISNIYDMAVNKAPDIEPMINRVTKYLEEKKQGNEKSYLTNLTGCLQSGSSNCS